MEREALLKRKSDFDIEEPNKRTSPVSSRGGSDEKDHSSRLISHYNSQISIHENTHTTHRRPNPSARSSSSSGSGSHRRRRKRASSLVRSSHSCSSLDPTDLSRQSSAVSVQRALDENYSRSPQHSAFHVDPQASSFVGECQASERRMSSPSVPPPLRGVRLEPSSFGEREEGKTHHVIGASNDNEQLAQAGPSTPLCRSGHLSPPGAQWNVHTPQPRSPHIIQPHMAKRGMEDARRWYGHVQSQTPSTPTRRGVAAFRTLHTNPSLVPIPTSPQGESRLRLYTEDDEPLPPPLVQSKYIDHPDSFMSLKLFS